MILNNAFKQKKKFYRKSVMIEATVSIFKL